MPKWWFDYRSANTLPEHATGEDITKRDLNLRLLADRKPYFMRYIYPKILHQYNKYIRDTDIRCYREFCMSVSDLLAIPVADRTERQAEFIRYYQDRMPVSDNDCVMNRICRRFEREFDGKAKMRSITETLDTDMLKCGVEYSERKFFDIVKIYHHHAERLADYLGDMSFNREGDRESRAEARAVMLETFKEDCLQVCSSEQELCDIVVDMCYNRESTKQFAWDVCGDMIVSNLLRRHDGVFSYPILDPDGDIEYCGETFSMIRKESDVWLKSY